MPTQEHHEDHPADHQAEDYIPLPQDGDKQAKYDNVIKRFEDLLDSGSHPLSNTSNLIALLKQEFGWWWIGFYFLPQGREYLALGQFQGPKACMKLLKGVGVCGTAWDKMETIILADVNAFPGHIACSSVSKSQIVIPIVSENTFIGVLDIDSAHYGGFNEVDEKKLKVLLGMCEKNNFWRWFGEKM